MNNIKRIRSIIKAQRKVAEWLDKDPTQIKFKDWIESSRHILCDCITSELKERIKMVIPNFTENQIRLLATKAFEVVDEYTTIGISLGRIYSADLIDFAISLVLEDINKQYLAIKKRSGVD